MLDFLKASWEHLPKPPKLPPSLFTLKARRAWLSVRPEFTYGDHRDKLQRRNTRRAQKELERDEAWARSYKKKQARAEKKAKAAVKRAADARAKKAQKSGFKPLAESKQANLPSRSQSMKAPATVNGWAALQVSAAPTSKRPGVVRSPSAPVPKTKPVVAPNAGVRAARPGTASRPTQQVVYRVPAQQQRPVAQPKRSATQPVPQQRVAVRQPAPAAKPVAVRSATMPSVPKRRS